MGLGRDESRVALLAILLPCFGALLAGCGGGGGSTDPPTPVPAPTAAPTAPTAPPTAPPTMPPTDKWAQATCAWLNKNVLTQFEVACDDKHRALRVFFRSYVTTMEPLDSSQSCKDAVRAFMAARCGSDVVTNQTDTTCACHHTDKGGMLLESKFVCDEAAKEQISTIINSQDQEPIKYPEGRDCAYQMGKWLEGQERGCASVSDPPVDKCCTSPSTNDVAEIEAGNDTISFAEIV